MGRRLDPRPIGRLVVAQRARRAAAEGVLGMAREAEACAQAEEEAALAELAGNQALWSTHLDQPSFSPEFARALAERMVASDTAAAQAGERRRLAGDARRRRAEEWRLAEARVRATEDEFAAARRAAARRREELRLAEFADQVTFAWVMA